MGEGVCGPARRRMRENLPDITRERAIPVNSPLISLPQAADSFSLRAKSRLRRLRFDTRLRAQPLGGSQRRKFFKIPRVCNIARGGFVLVYRRSKREEVWELTNKEFTGLMQQYQKLIYTVCLQFVHEPHTAEDLTQDTFLSAFSAIDRCEPQYYKQWLVRVAANKCKDHLKSAWVRKVDAPGDDALPEPRGAPGSDADDPAQSVADRAGAAELETLVRGLREPYGKIAVLYFLEHRETAEIAKLVGRPPATVNSQLWRAKLLLRQQITERRQNE